MPSTNLQYCLGFAKIDNIGPITLKKLFNHFENLETAWQADFFVLQKAGLGPKTATQIIEQRQQIDPRAELENLQEKNISAITIDNDSFPALLKEIHACPCLLYYIGNLEILNNPCLAVVGTRKISNYGQRVTPQIVGPLARKGITIVSGLALGVDALAHKTALREVRKTVAILGSGLDNIYPRNNLRLAEDIVTKGGLLISEYPPGTEPLKEHFPQRNRIISGLSLGTIVIEGTKDSGSLITAKYALDQNREVFAVPQDITKESSMGPNQLIKMGAKPITSAEDVLEELNLDTIKQPVKQTEEPKNPDQKTIFQILKSGEKHFDEIVKTSKLNVQIVNQNLTIMEMQGIVKNLGGGNYMVVL